jgi:hypothetical protein
MTKCFCSNCGYILTVHVGEYWRATISTDAHLQCTMELLISAHSWPVSIPKIVP